MSDLDNLLQKGPIIVNIGLKSFLDSCEIQGVQIFDLKWAPPAGGDPKLLKLLDKLL